MSENVDVARRVFRAVEERDLQALLDCYDEDIEIREAESLPYGGVYHGHDGAIAHAAGWFDAWGDLQTAEDSRLEPTFLEGEEGTVGVVFRHRASDPEHRSRLDGAEVGVYSIRDGKVVRSQMFHADSAAVVQFLERARAR
jgi:ketosteroid isomerase-like protein